jgi:hypothetical protein
MSTTYVSGLADLARLVDAQPLTDAEPGRVADWLWHVAEAIDALPGGEIDDTHDQLTAIAEQARATAARLVERAVTEVIGQALPTIVVTPGGALWPAGRRARPGRPAPPRCTTPTPCSWA